MNNILTVFLNKQKAGFFSRNEDGRYSFRYDLDYLNDTNSIPLSPRLPKIDKVFGDLETRIFFANLVPEGSLYAGMCRFTHIDVSDKFKFLSKWGRECAGALVFSQTDSYPCFNNYKLKVDLTNFYKTDKSIISILPNIDYKTIQPRLSLAGGQDKTPIIIDDDKNFWYPFGDLLSTHILKIDISGFPANTRNEIFCLHLASELNLPVVDNFLYPVKKGSFACIKRYDRLNGIRLHQVDFCQVLGILPEKKYQEDNHGNNLLKSILDFCNNNKVETPSGDSVAEYFAKIMAYNYLIKNTDAHCKNFSLLYIPYQNGYKLQLSPFYDLNSMHIYNVDSIMAMSYGDEINYYKIRWKDFNILAKLLNIKSESMYSILKDMACNITDIAYEVAQKHKELYHDAPCYDSLIRRIGNSSKNLLNFLKKYN